MRRALLALGLLLSAAPAHASSITFSLTTGNSGGLDAFPGPYADVTITLLDPTHALLTFDSLTTAGTEFLMAGNDAIGVNVNATTFSATGFTGGNDGSGFSNQFSDLSFGGSNVMDGFGTFGLTIDSFDGYSHSWSEIGFALTNLSGVWLAPLDVLLANSLGNLAAIHGFACADQPGTLWCSQSAGALATGFASGFGSSPPPPPPPPPPPNPVPEPTTFVLLASGLVGVWRARR